MIDYNAVAALAALITALTAIVALWIQSRRARFAMGIDLLMKLDQNFQRGTVVQARRVAGLGLKAGSLSTADDVLDFFEMIGMLTRRGVLDPKLVWHNFFYWVDRYCVVTRNYIRDVQAKDPTVWQDLVWLHARLRKIEMHERGCVDSELEISAEVLNEFLNEEASHDIG